MPEGAPLSAPAADMNPAAAALNDPGLKAAERRIRLLMRLLGIAATGLAGVFFGWRAAFGAAAGAILAEWHLRWIGRQVDRWMIQPSTQAARNAPAVPGAALPAPAGYKKLLGWLRWLILAGVLYATLKVAWLPPLAVLAGFSSLAGGVMLEAGYLLTQYLRHNL